MLNSGGTCVLSEQRSVGRGAQIVRQCSSESKGQLLHYMKAVLECIPEASRLYGVLATNEKAFLYRLDRVRNNNTFWTLCECSKEEVLPAICTIIREMDSVTPKTNPDLALRNYLGYGASAKVYSCSPMHEPDKTYFSSIHGKMLRITLSEKKRFWCTCRMLT
ncbi:hypothetical protein HK102_001819, partial [Quaeritorhiza haematococci]